MSGLASWLWKELHSPNYSRRSGPSAMKAAAYTRPRGLWVSHLQIHQLQHQHHKHVLCQEPDATTKIVHSAFVITGAQGPSEAVSPAIQESVIWV